MKNKNVVHLLIGTATACGETVFSYQTYAADLVTCPKCASDAVKKMPAAAGPAPVAPSVSAEAVLAFERNALVLRAQNAARALRTSLEDMDREIARANTGSQTTFNGSTALRHVLDACEALAALNVMTGEQK